MARFAYNWALAEWRCEYKAGGEPSEMMLRKRLNALKREQFPWMLEVSKCAAREAIINLGVSFSNFFRDRNKPKAQRRFHYPKPKNKGVHDSFCAANEVGTFRCDGKRVKLPVVGWVRMREALRFEGIAKYVTVARELAPQIAYGPLRLDQGQRTHLLAACAERLKNIAGEQPFEVGIY